MQDELRFGVLRFRGRAPVTLPIAEFERIHITMKVGAVTEAVALPRCGERSLTCQSVALKSEVVRVLPAHALAPPLPDVRVCATLHRVSALSTWHTLAANGRAYRQCSPRASGSACAATGDASRLEFHSWQARALLIAG